MFDRKFIFTQLKEIILMFLIGGIISTYMTCRDCFAHPNIAMRIWLFCGFMWVFLWKGNELISCQIDHSISWINKPGKRFLTGLISMLIYTVSIVSLITYLFVEYFQTREIGMSFRGSIVYVIEYSIGITVIIMLFFLSKDFLMSWRQSAINEEKLRRENIASQYEALKNQVNPHFLFNTLNALSSLIYEDPDKAVQFINKFSDVYRYVLDSKDKEVIPLKEEIDFVRSYFYLLKTRYENNLEVSIDDNLPDGFVPPMAIQLLVENAIKHNVIADDSHIRIDILREGDYIIVENNVKLKNINGKSSGLGIENIRSRYTFLSDKPVLIKNNGSVFSVSIPVLKMGKDY